MCSTFGPEPPLGQKLGLFSLFFWKIWRQVNSLLNFSNLWSYNELSDPLILNKTMRGAEVPPILVVPVPATMVETIFKLFRSQLKLLEILRSNQKSFSSKNLPVKLRFKNPYLMSFTHWVMWKIMIIVWHWIEVDGKSKRKRRIIVITVEWTMIQVGLKLVS